MVNVLFKLVIKILKTDIANTNYLFEVALITLCEEDSHTAVITTLLHCTHEITFDEFAYFIETK